MVQRHGAGGAFAVEAGPLGLASGGGRPLPDAVRGKMEAALGANFADVRVYVGPQAERIGAIAFTVGSDIYFAPGRFQPDTMHGQQLLGHELAHVVQQRAGRVRNPLGTGLAVVQDTALEAEADRLGQRAAAHRVAPGANQTSRPAQRRSVGIAPPTSAGPRRNQLMASSNGPPGRWARIDIPTIHIATLGAVQRSRGSAPLSLRTPVTGPGVAPPGIRHGMVLQMEGPNGESLGFHPKKWHGWSKHGMEWFENRSGIRTELELNTVAAKVFNRIRHKPIGSLVLTEIIPLKSNGIPRPMS
jgi:hypothetical protein